MKQSTGPILLVGTADQSPDLVYATEFRAPDPVVFLRTGRGDLLVVPDLEYGRALRAVSGTEVLTPAMLSLKGPQRRRVEGWACGVVRYAGVRSVRTGPDLPLSVARRLERIGVRVQIVSGAVFPGRACKSAEECGRIRESQQAAVIAMRAAKKMIASARIDPAGNLLTGAEPLTSERVRRAINESLLRQDCLCADTIVACGRQAADPHEMGEGTLRAGEAIVIDIFPRHLGHGYWGDLTRTVVRGRPSSRLRKMYSAVRAAQTAALAKTKAGVECARVHRAAADEIKRRGFETLAARDGNQGFIHSTGHGVGLCVHEAPSLGPAEGRLRSGNVVTVEPGLYYRDIGGVRIEDTVVVTPAGWRYLAPCEKGFEL